VALGPLYGYHVNLLKLWLVNIPRYLEVATTAFKGTHMNITTVTEGTPHLGAALGTPEYVQQFVSEKVTQWCKELEKPATIADTQPHVAYAALTCGLVSMNLPFLNHPRHQQHLRSFGTHPQNQIYPCLDRKAIP